MKSSRALSAFFEQEIVWYDSTIGTGLVEHPKNYQLRKQIGDKSYSEFKRLKLKGDQEAQKLVLDDIYFNMKGYRPLVIENGVIHFSKDKDQRIAKSHIGVHDILCFFTQSNPNSTGKKDRLLVSPWTTQSQYHALLADYTQSNASDCNFRIVLPIPDKEPEVLYYGNSVDNILQYAKQKLIGYQELLLQELSPITKQWDSLFVLKPCTLKCA